MAKEIQLAHGVTGRTLYAVVRDTVGQVWNGSAFETYAGGNWTTYAVTMAEETTGGSSGYYRGTFPTVAAGVYSVEVRWRAGGSPALTDSVVGTGRLEWDGSAVAAVSSRLAASAYSAPLDAAGTRSAVGLASANLDTQLSGIAADLPGRVTKNTALAGFMFFMADSSNHVSGKTGLTVTATRSLDGAAFAACANAVAEVSDGWYKIDLAAADLNGNVVALRFSATGADTRNVTVVTQPT